MLTSIEVMAALLLAAWPAWGVAAWPPVSLPVLTAARTAATPANDPASLLNLSDEELTRLIEFDAALLGTLSIGAPGGGLLLNGVALPDGPRWVTTPTAAPWATSETITAIQTAVDTVHDLFPDTPPIVIGDISDQDGGRLKRHETHQAGRDVDFGFYLKSGQGPWFVPGTAANLDLPRNWALVRALVARTDVETILLDTRVQRLLYKYALSISEDKDWLDRVFQFSRGSKSAIIRHVRGHRNHYHVRFYSPVAQELGRRAHPIMVQLGLLAPPVFTVRHVVRPGQTMGHLAAKYGTSIRAIKQANGLSSTLLRAGRAYRIPVRGVAPPPQPLMMPQRILPPSTPDALAAVDWPSVESLYGSDGER